MKWLEDNIGTYQIQNAKEQVSWTRSRTYQEMYTTISAHKVDIAHIERRKHNRAVTGMRR